MKDKTWACICGLRHTGMPWREFAPEHQPVSAWEARLANAEETGE